MNIKNIYASFLLFLIVIISVIIMIIPTFFTKGIARVSSDKRLNLPLILNDKKDIKLLFFGYSGCRDICTPRLYSINDFYHTLDSSIKKRVGVEFLDISTPCDKTLPLRFAQFFNKNFKGIYLDKNILRDYTKAFNVFFSPSLLEENEYDHTSNLYLVKKTQGEKVLRYIYHAYPYNYKQITLDIKELLNE